MPLSLASLCAFGACGHPYNWHLGTGGETPCSVNNCNCQIFRREDGAANPNRVIVENREEIRNIEDHPVPRFTTKDSGVRAAFDSGMVRDTNEGKARFELLWPKDVPYAQQFMTRVAELLGRGAAKYEDRNWEKATGDAEIQRFEESALRHMMQWLAGETDEDHAAAVVFNLLGAETTKWKRDNGQE